MTVSPPADTKTPETRRVGGPLRLLAQRSFALVRNTWRTLTSMGTALVLLFLLALGAIPGALLPQRSLNEAKVNE
ncbi:MAG TPA: cytochrome c biogenesis protein ResB, partial [Mycobacterium sp.]|nr:cytochrome c biogenesis protein ResB [Mycobacterium sp.]